MTMTDEDLERRFAFAHDLIRSAGALALSYYRDLGSLDVRMKGRQDHVSQADVETEALIREALLDAYPLDDFVGEESGSHDRGQGRGAWVVDPIDGTQPFLLGIPTWCISIAFVADDEVQLGLVLNPVTDELFAARRGHGATLNGATIHVRDAATLADGLTTVGCSSRTGAADLSVMVGRLLTAGGMYHRTGSGAWSLCYVAGGRLIGYVEMSINSWDCLAAVLLVSEAGGRVSDFLHQNGIAGGGPLVAGTPDVYDALVDVMPASARARLAQ